MEPANHIFDIEFTCSQCKEVSHIEGKISTILRNIQNSGWPICPECGKDMEESVIE